MRALVTGGCGFIGSCLSKRLVDEGWTVDIVDDMSNGHLEFLGDYSFRVVPIQLGHHFEEKSKRKEGETNTQNEKRIMLS